MNIVDEHTRETLVMEVDRSMGADQVGAVIKRLFRAEAPHKISE